MNCVIQYLQAPTCAAVAASFYNMSLDPSMGTLSGAAYINAPDDGVTPVVSDCKIVDASGVVAGTVEGNCAANGLVRLSINTSDDNSAYKLHYTVKNSAGSPYSALSTSCVAPVSKVIIRALHV